MKAPFLAVFLVLAILGLSVTASYALDPANPEPGCYSEIKKAQNNYSDAMRVRNRAYTRNMVQQSDSVLGLMCFDMSMNLTSSLGAIFSDVFSNFFRNFAVPTEWFKFSYKLAIRIPTLRDYLCANKTQIKVEAGASASLGQICHSKTSMPKRLDNILSSALLKHQNQFNNSLSRDTSHGSIATSTSLSLTLPDFSASSLAECIDFRGLIGEAIANLASRALFPDWDPNAVLAAFAILSGAFTLQGLLCNPEAIRAALQSLLDALTNIKCRKLSSTWKAHGKASVEGGGAAKTSPYLKTNALLSATPPSGSGGSRFNSELTSPTGPSADALKAARRDMSDTVDGLFKGSPRFSNYPLTPEFSVRGQHTESSKDIINKMNAAD